MIHSFLLIGQSNAAGRGFLTDAVPLDTCENKLKILRNGRWHTMFRPVNPDRPFSGVCFAESFAKEYSKVHPEVEVGIIPCADGGTTLEQWKPGELLFDNAICCAKLAMRTSHLMGILWHQGEGDCSLDKYPFYQENFKIIMDEFRKCLGLPNLPILVGGLGDFLSECTLSENLKHYPYVNNALQQLATEYPNCAYVSAEGLGANPDNLHFNAQALNEFGLRYFEVFQNMDLKNHISAREEKENDSIRTEMEYL